MNAEGASTDAEQSKSQSKATTPSIVLTTTDVSAIGDAGIPPPLSEFAFSLHLVRSAPGH